MNSHVISVSLNDLMKYFTLIFKNKNPGENLATLWPSYFTTRACPVQNI